VRADAVVVAGGGAFCDAFAAHARGLLDTLAGAVVLGKPAALLSCGFEALEDPELMRLARLVLPELHLIGCREGLVGPTFLRSLGVDPVRVVVTGDDALKAAHEARHEALGTAIGVSLRLAPYSGLDESLLDRLRVPLQSAAERHQAALVPLPISVFGPSDGQALDALLEQSPVAAADSPTRVFADVSRCRVVVTGSYHAAVFALAQGISVVAFAASHHYATKLKGLGHAFGPACAVLRADDSRFSVTLSDAIERAWTTAEERRPELLAATRRQLTGADDAYARLRHLL
jgi:polysaccharide pyruvyl transferase WcaK-like protein